jgi:DNA-binding PadR family transcriptional regulator
MEELEYKILHATFVADQTQLLLTGKELMQQLFPEKSDFLTASILQSSALESLKKQGFLTTQNAGTGRDEKTYYLISEKGKRAVAIEAKSRRKNSIFGSSQLGI